MLVNTIKQLSTLPTLLGFKSGAWCGSQLYKENPLAELESTYCLCWGLYQDHGQVAKFEFHTLKTLEHKCQPVHYK